MGVLVADYKVSETVQDTMLCGIGFEDEKLEVGDEK